MTTTTEPRNERNESIASIFVFMATLAALALAISFIPGTREVGDQSLLTPRSMAGLDFFAVSALVACFIGAVINKPSWSTVWFSVSFALVVVVGGVAGAMLLWLFAGEFIVKTFEPIAAAALILALPMMFGGLAGGAYLKWTCPDAS